MRDASTPKRKLTTKIFHVNSFVVLFSYIFLLWQFKILIECFSSNQFDEIKHVLLFKNWIQLKCLKFCCLYYQLYLIQLIPLISFSYVKSFFKTCISVNLFVFFESFSVFLFFFSSFLVCITYLRFHMLLNFEHLVFAALDLSSYYNKDTWRNQNKAINKGNIIKK